MAQLPELRTPRLLLRAFRDGDAGAFAAMNADPRVMAHFPAALSRAESDALLASLRAASAREAFGVWAVELAQGGAFAGMVGLDRATFEAPFTPCVEVLWRLAPQHWGKGYATEAARAAVEHGFTRAGLGEILSWTVPANRASWRVMERLGMTHDQADDFDHPRVPAGHRLRRHVLYRLRAPRG